MSPLLTKELLVFAIALILSGAVLQSRRAAPVSPAPLPRVPPVEAPADVPKEEIPVARPRQLKEARSTEGRDPFAGADMWEDPKPLPLPLPPELPPSRIVPVLSIDEGRARAPRPPEIGALPKVRDGGKP